jgi:hypothetical protein
MNDEDERTQGDDQPPGDEQQHEQAVDTPAEDLPVAQPTETRRNLTHDAVLSIAVSADGKSFDILLPDDNVRRNHMLAELTYRCHMKDVEDAYKLRAAMQQAGIAGGNGGVQKAGLGDVMRFGKNRRR